MATILPRRRADRPIGYMATIRLHSKKKLLHRETKTFLRRAAAQMWARIRWISTAFNTSPSVENEAVGSTASNMRALALSSTISVVSRDQPCDSAAPVNR
jgi:hypothetical protein